MLRTTRRATLLLLTAILGYSIGAKAQNNDCEKSFSVAMKKNEESQGIMFKEKNPKKALYVLQYANEYTNKALDICKKTSLRENTMMIMVRSANVYTNGLLLPASNPTVEDYLGCIKAIDEELGLLRYEKSNVGKTHELKAEELDGFIASLEQVKAMLRKSMNDHVKKFSKEHFGK